MTKPFSILIKPASADCNLKCNYCFYLDRCELYPESKTHRMNDTVLDHLISSYMETEQPIYSFNWQGGEPTLMGSSFFRRVVELQQKYGARGCQVSNAVQTNATLIDDEMASLFAEYKFLLGVSLDGPEDIHDYYRKSYHGAGSHKKVLEGIETLKRHKVEFNTLTLINNVNVKRGKDLYCYLRDEGFNYHQYIPCVEFDDKGVLMPYSVDAMAWGDFLCDIFDEWIKNDVYKVSIRLFDAILGLMIHGNYHLCNMAGNCCQYLVVEYNGDVFPCDFFVTEELKIGNIMDSSWDRMLESSDYREFGSEKNNWDKQCSQCKYLNFCSGDCIKHRMPTGEHSETVSRLCSGWKKFFHHTLPWFEAQAIQIQKQYQKNNAKGYSRDLSLYPTFNIGRNETCFCGSEKKFKKCHGQI